jgi:AcrR family transcriptional regulator
MTRFVKLVIMVFESVRDLQQSLIGYVGDIGDGDAKGRKRLRIIEEATQLFVTHGYRKTAMGEIAKASGMAKGTIYLYFETKADVLVAAVAYEKYRTMSLLECVFDVGISGRERLLRWVIAAISMVLESPLLCRVATEMHEFERELMERFGQVSSASRSEHDDFMGQLIDDAISPKKWASEDRHEQLVALYSLIRVAPMLRNEQIRQGVSLERLVETTARVIVEGLHPRSESTANESAAR